MISIRLLVDAYHSDNLVYLLCTFGKASIPFHFWQPFAGHEFRYFISRYLRVTKNHFKTGFFTRHTGER